MTTVTRTPDQKLPVSFYSGDTLGVARNLLGKFLVRKTAGGAMVGKIVETEAYHEVGDPSCHAHRGMTARNAVMFGPPGRLYVYFTYGMHYCMNIVTEKEGVAAAVLIRALEPVAGIPLMQKNRGPKAIEKNLANGPAKLCQALAITTAQNGHSLQSDDLYVSNGETVLDADVVTTTRIGISAGADLPWRFYLRGNPFVSKK